MQPWNDDGCIGKTPRYAAAGHSLVKCRSGFLIQDVSPTL